MPQLLVVGLNGLEPSTSRLSGVRSNQLSYRPINNNWYFIKKLINKSLKTEYDTYKLLSFLVMQNLMFCVSP